MLNGARIVTDRGVTFFWQGKTYSVAKDHEAFEEIAAQLKADSYEGALEVLNRPKKIVQEMLTQHFMIEEGALYLVPDLNNPQVREGVNDYLMQRVFDLHREGWDLKPLENFMLRLRKNPSRRAVQGLYEFLEKGGFHILEDGRFLAYKAVRADFKDIHSGTFDNSIGARLEMSRNMVDDDPTRTCSHGFHVCSFEYLPSFSHANGHVMICAVDPADVVSIPIDYNFAKMRVCAYEVVDEHKGYYENEGRAFSSVVHPIDSDIDAFDDDDDNGLGDDTSGDYDYVVNIVHKDGWLQSIPCTTLEAAKEEAISLFRGDGEVIRVVSVSDDIVHLTIS